MKNIKTCLEFCMNYITTTVVSFCHSNSLCVYFYWAHISHLSVALNVSLSLLTCNCLHAFSCCMCNVAVYGTHSPHMHTQPNLKIAFKDRFITLEK